MTQAVVVGGLFIGVLSALPIINVANCCCLWVMSGGAIAVALARQERSGPVGLAEGARIGFRAGMFGAFVWVFASMAVDTLMAPVQQRMADLMLRNATDMPDRLARSRNRAESTTIGAARMLSRQRKLIFNCIG